MPAFQTLLEIINLFCDTLSKKRPQVMSNLQKMYLSYVLWEKNN